MGSVREYTGMGQPVGHPGIEPRLCGTPGAYDLGFLGAPPPLPTPACWQHRVGEAAQVLVAPQDLRPTRTAREDMGDVGSTNSTMETGRPEAEDLWRE